MSETMWIALTLATVGAVVLTYLQRRHLARVQRDRTALFEHATGVLEQSRIVPRGLDYPMLYGRYNGRDVRVEPVVDALAIRTVPVLRLVVTMREQLPGQPRLSVLSNETGNEFYSGHRDLLRWRDPAWPTWASVACAPEGVDRELAEAAVGFVTEDSMVKQVLVTERGVRCIVRGAQANSTAYRVTRRVDLSEVRVTAENLLQAVTMAGELCDQAASRRLDVSEAESW
ncbi:hypothetical protein FZI85_11590 [Mycobacterium sp. CBMA293]|uniref:hypothetical protein n=1 Tax=unclassified Mycolicibacterium TaxID=2636767 RepID=UPI0012DF626E|nr:MULTISPECIES: hypothetical protein [unclassified Mycolicibacterium]MUL46523.1 hypothetical protein [Mycolicibacterium sp. CBMA 360]MUL59178.1 hypothetical protein [Mycolicibacterium sp. CBMA 335]MUL69572.1 hypothetical protein [Mycolicibacterium sp. CBMA 311]MUL94536.1 hypothetical protein [Mycolicibacterium sp. CBMA 230]MUM06448.1 hypothetical protein [Mycolicibacterium sp. CBMA 213]